LDTNSAPASAAQDHRTGSVQEDLIGSDTLTFFPFVIRMGWRADNSYADSDLTYTQYRAAPASMDYQASGFLIGPRVVLTAAHNLVVPGTTVISPFPQAPLLAFQRGLRAYRVWFQLGSFVAARGWGIIHPNYERATWAYDFGLIILDQDVNVTARDNNIVTSFPLYPNSAGSWPLATVAVNQAQGTLCYCPQVLESVLQVSGGPNGGDIGRQPPGFLDGGVPPVLTDDNGTFARRRAYFTFVTARDYQSGANGVPYPSLLVSSRVTLGGDSGSPLLAGPPGAQGLPSYQYAVGVLSGTVATGEATYSRITPDVVRWILDTITNQSIFPPTGLPPDWQWPGAAPAPGRNIISSSAFNFYAGAGAGIWGGGGCQGGNIP
jgi:hypothetical protein